MENQFRRAVTGLEVLRGIGTTVALNQLSALKTKSSRGGIKERAEILLQEVAKERQLSPEQLEDILIPDLQLNEHGTRTLSFGSRTFSVHLSEDLKAVLRDDTGAIRADLPKPGKKDDANLAEDAKREWKVLKKALSEVAKNQAARLEAAMVVGRRWRTEDFRTLLVRHPVMQLLTRRIVWAGIDNNGLPIQLFRVGEEGEFRNSKDDPVMLGDTVTIPHPLNLTEDEKRIWGEVFVDYKISALFPQLSRKVYLLDEGERDLERLDRFNGCKVSSLTILGTLQRLGWQRGEILDGGCYSSHLKHFPGLNLTVMVEYNDGIVFGLNEDVPQTITGVRFFDGLHREIHETFQGDYSQTPKVIRTVPKVVISEVLSELGELVSKN